MGINKYVIKQQGDKQTPNGPIYRLGSVKVETLKTYIKAHLKIGFIWPSKSPTDTFILFN